MVSFLVSIWLQKSHHIYIFSLNSLPKFLMIYYLYDSLAKKIKSKTMFYFTLNLLTNVGIIFNKKKSGQ